VQRDSPYIRSAPAGNGEEFGVPDCGPSRLLCPRLFARKNTPRIKIALRQSRRGQQVAHKFYLAPRVDGGDFIGRGIGGRGIRVRGISPADGGGGRFQTVIAVVVAEGRIPDLGPLFSK